MKQRLFTVLLGALLNVLSLASVPAANQPAPTAGSSFATPLAVGDLDTNAFVAWVEGAEKPVTVKER